MDDRQQQQQQKKKKVEDRISSLPDELIHQILKFVDDTKLGVQTSVLSKRWKLVWTSLPFLKLNVQCLGTTKFANNFTRHVLNNRNHESQISNLELTSLTPRLVAKFVEYAICHHVEYLKVTLRHGHVPYKLSNFSSSYIRKLELEIKLEEFMSKSDCWVLPALTCLHLTTYLFSYIKDKLPEICLTCLPALTTLFLTNWDLESLSFRLPGLTTLVLSTCTLPNKVWNFPALNSLTLDDVIFPENMSDIFAALVGLQNLTLCSYKVSIQASIISCPQLVNLEIKNRYYNNATLNETLKNNIVFLAPRLSNFTSVGIFPITFGDCMLDNVNIKLRGWNDRKDIPPKKLNEYYQRFTSMLSGLGSAKILNLDLETIEALSSIFRFTSTFRFLVKYPSPFYNLKYVKLPKGWKEESLDSTLRSYLLDGSPTATIVTALPQNLIPHAAAASVTAQNVVIEETLAASTKLVDSEDVQKTVCVDTVDVGVQEELVVQNSEVHAGGVVHVGCPVEGTCNDQVSSYRGNIESGKWRGHEVNSEFVCLLDQIMNKYPETFEHLTTKNKKFCTTKLNMLCAAVNDFTKIPMTEVDTEMISEYRDVFAAVQKLGFNVSWLVSRLNFIEQLRFSQLLPRLHATDCHHDDAKSNLQDLQIRIDDARTKLHDLQTLRAEKMQEFRKPFGSMDTNLVGYVGDDLFLAP